MRVNCPECGGRALITKSSEETSGYRVLYCTCKNPLCKCGFVTELTIKKIIRSSLLRKNELLKLSLLRLSKEDKEDIFQILKQERENMPCSVHHSTPSNYPLF